MKSDIIIELPVEALMYTKEFIDSLGGKEKARDALIDIINRYFTPEYIDFEALN